MKEKKPLIILTGPTAVGKTELSVRLAKAINGEIISADSIQVYKYMDIGSAKVMPDEMDGITHYMIDELYPDEEFNIFYFKEKAKEYVDKIYAKGKIPIIAGGTGFYIQALLYDIDFSSESSEEKDAIRKELEDIYEKNGATYLHNMLREIDPESAAIIHENNVKRVIRAIEFYKLSGTKISWHNEQESSKESPYDFKYYCLNMNRELLYKRIEDRVDIMMENGLVDEVRGLLDMGYHRELVSMQGIGYKEIVSYIMNEATLAEAIEELKKQTRHLAKRQLTWFKRNKDIIWINIDEINSTDRQLDYIKDYIDKKGFLNG